MNASFSILQKIKSQFLQGTSNKTDYQVAFAPFAFTLSNDDFYFLKNTANTGAEARKYLKEQSEFAILANSILKHPSLWKIDGDNLLYDRYKQLLNSALTIDPDALSADETSRVNKARAVLFNTNGNDSNKYVSYKKYAGKASDIEKKLIDQQALKTGLAASDSAGLEKWNLDFQNLTNQKKELLIEWQVKGFKSTVEAAKATFDAVFLSKSSFLERWQEAKNIKTASANLLTDEYGVEFLSTTCIPNAICDYQAPIWKKITLAKPDIAQLTQSFTQEVAASVLAEFGDLQPELDSITFEYCLIDILRPWFDESLINNRLWKYADASLQLAAGDASLTGQIPAYPVKIILAKNIELVFTPNSAVNETIKTQLKSGSQLFFGPLLLKTIPQNLPDNKISAFRVQQLSTPELAAITQVALQNPAGPLKFDGVRKLQMIELLNRKPQVELRRTVEFKPLLRMPTVIAPPVVPAPAPAPAVALAARPQLMAASALLQRPGTIGVMPIRNLPQIGFPGSVFSPAPPPAPAPSPPAPPAICTMRGKVFSEANAPLAVAEIQVMNLANLATQSVLSLEDGSYVLPNLARGRYQLKVRKAGRVTQEKTIDLQTDSTQDFLLSPQAVPTESFQVIGVICKKLPRLPNPMPDGAYI